VAEQWLRMYGQLYDVPGVVLRGFSIYGPGQLVSGGTSGVLSIFVQRALADAPLVIDSPSLRDFVEVADAAVLVRLALTHPRAVGGVYNIGSGVATPLRELAERVRAVTGSRSHVEGPPPGEASGYVADLTRARAELGYNPRVTLAEGLVRYVDWYQRTR
jgi:UDP-glucose 4-epimerase